ncbi:threonine--tRNA ligase [Candidatus Viridilinea mediisalina]|uniref:Threonine--tRNA ligase n=1 Tax=Candidatus Viridilinea mediisalina TaxID=2024553 RepID=A0A2A6RGK8_9CHLR|nr:threonine--tRNA ligase [Candidatus Viridilinea mediisalina]PDW02071.1 threonine--tRNA ligase [Candidatus Viridilinea mediisalina]
MPADPQRDPYYRLRHSLAHVMAQAVLELFPEGKIAIGPPVEHGFYYDFDLPRSLTPDDLGEIETRMRRIIGGNHPFHYRVVSAAEARELFADQPYKLELIAGLASGADEYGEVQAEAETTVISTYKHDTFEDLCRGPHLEHTGQIDPAGFKLMSIAGAYWRGNEQNPQLQRVYGTAWHNQSELDQYLWRLEEAKKRDHRRLGKELDLYSISEEVGPGLILWHPKGAMIRVIAEDFSRQAHLKAGYEWVFSPHLGRAHLWETSGHLEFYQESMYAPMDVDGEHYYPKPMNCPFHIKIFQSHMRSYRDLPRRYAEYGTVYRYELSGALHGLTRVRGFTQDDAHIFCRPDQVEEEIGRALEFSLYVLRSFGLSDFTAYLSTRPEKYVGAVEDWERATAALERAVQTHGLPYQVDEGGGAFYGPKIDLKVYDALGREWQLSTIQFDFNLPERFGLEYVGEDNQAHRPYMVHRALMGSIERFLGVLIEHYAGAFPLWLAPVQAMIIPITDKHVPYAEQVCEQLKAAGLRVELDLNRDRMQGKIRRAQLQKIPYMLIIGNKEQEAGAVAVRTRSGEDLGPIAVGAFIERATEEVKRNV